ncbi:MULTISPECIES: fumarylacetoacetate hydrolase family protein [Tatumella]|uniref:Fumarylacetoacetate hydrolase family protein n=1 Tax=Tatumella punctata TaxID=399969 RepID=A0ABW1VI75_9GAMM|nr:MULTISPECIES: fumarylacetoacetate hydrolase family protein [unclassified Tatumella]MBS0855362.1 fumarylacetoacetate hydrolase family protein [Tatumella sp. JGM16]MBS0877268.1 fumarylacetoacetate hydrolase family protein [Tatumella sp. JGM82]MBS0889363.1 fumarylacetoacetate hydrolase family protein [Tatumella sp. JGM94]MBS0894089.1 fumarylacetoacetate hydrolase family protein [Tatumella sp. JGM130]MBS0901665.1 fumarylacetoacetate hydrolase family protein [Tatumella sp. JGM100]
MYQHRNWQGELLNLPAGKVVCVGSNYARHISEMGSITPEEPVLFIKPETALCDLRQPLKLLSELGEIHHEVELAVLIGSTLQNAREDQVLPAIAGYGVALDLTLRTIQAGLKKKGQPWEKSKGFDNSCPVSGFVPAVEFSGDAQSTPLALEINGDIRQSGNTRDMMYKIVPLIAYMSRFFTLRPGDIILTGTPEGVGPLLSGDSLSVSFADCAVTTRVL